ncbi:MAG: DUF1540 domain-containing protein [Clostridia bacterium]|nr:DUF1540 domain-containing protein [Clostridia bacterium]
MDKCNVNIKCDVKNCQHNCEGRHCYLDSIKVTCGERSCTVCQDYEENVY